MRRFTLSLFTLLLFAAPAQAVVTENGYLSARDGTKLRYQVQRPDGPGPFPTLINYEGYAAGTNAADNGVSTYRARLLERGYALVGVSVRGTGCSQGEFDPFDETMGTDGYDAVEWAAAQPWSDGRVGMIGVSFGGITQLVTARTQPPHLKAIAPSSALSDLYRDVAYPGGILEYDFTFAWTAIQKQGGTAYVASNPGDAECRENYANHEVANTDHFIPKLVAEHPFYDDAIAGNPQDSWIARAPKDGFDEIQVPTLLLNAWQDEQLPARIFGELDRFARPDLLWVDVTNGNHGRDYGSAPAERKTLDFLDHFVRGVENGFESRPHLSIGIEAAISRNGLVNEPAWRIERDTIDPGATAKSLYLHEGAELSEDPPSGSEPGDGYLYPLPAPDVAEPGPVVSGRSTGQFAWKAVPTLPLSSVSYTTAPLDRDVVVAGPASLDLWLSSTSSDTDVQVTVTEVRPDGQETYVQRGWLRASHRKLDPERSTATRPYQTHLRADAQPLARLEPTLMRVEVFPFAHAFRAGSRLRVWIEAPTSHTGFWAFAPHPEPGINTVLHDSEHPSRLVLPVLEGETAQAQLPACDTLRNQPCRPDPLG